MMRRLVFAMIIGLAGLPAGALATTYTVKPDFTGDFPTIQEAIDHVANEDIIELVDGTYHGTGFNQIDFKGKRLTLRSQSGAPDVCIIDLEWGSPGITVGCGAGATITGVTIERGREYAIRVSCDGALTVDSCHFFSNRGFPGQGGAVCLDSTAPASFTNCLFRENTAVGRGGAVFANGMCTFSACQFVENSEASVSPGTNEGGGAIFAGGALVVTDCTFENNKAFSNGGAIYVRGAATAITGSTFSGNIVNGGPEMSSGGAISCPVGSPSVTNCHFIGNQVTTSAARGGALFTSGGTVSACEFRTNEVIGGDNVLENLGGAVSTSGTVVDCIFQGNVARGKYPWNPGVGGAVETTGQVQRCVFSGNKGTHGAAVAVVNGNATITECTLFGNEASGGDAASGGALYVRLKEAVIERTIIAFGTAGGAIVCVGATPNLSCCDLFGNIGGDWQGDCLTWQAAFLGNFSADPLFVDPAGGSFQLSSTSPCLPGLHPRGDSCATIGAMPSSGVPVRPITWSGIKSLFHR